MDDEDARAFEQGSRDASPNAGPNTSSLSLSAVSRVYLFSTTVRLARCRQPDAPIFILRSIP